MIQLIKSPSRIKAAGKKEKIVEEFFGRVNSDSPAISIARMKSAGGWEEPGQCPEFDEYTVVLRGSLQVCTRHEMHIVTEWQAILVKAGKWVRYSTPFAGGAEYIAVCLPAFSPETVHRDEF